MYNPRQYWEDRGGEGYRTTIRVPGYEKHLMAEGAFFEEFLREKKPKSLLDFGCGAGEWLGLWRNEKIDSVSIYEISSTMLGAAKKLAAQLWGCEWHPADCPVRANLASDNRLPLPYEDGEFDMIVACEVLAHILPDELEPTVKELHRILKPGGCLALVVPMPFKNGAEYNFSHDYNSLLPKHFKVEYDYPREPYRHLLCVRPEND